VFGVPHPRWGEEISVAVRLSKPGVPIDAMCYFLVDRMARQKVPKHWQIVEDSPRNSSARHRNSNCNGCSANVLDRIRSKNWRERMDKGKVALVTGGSRGIGAALAKALCGARVDVGITFFSPGTTRRSARRTGRARPRLSGRPGRSRRLGPLIASVMEHFGNLDILVNNTGISTLQEVGSETHIPALDRIWALNAIGVVATIRAAARVMSYNGRTSPSAQARAPALGSKALPIIADRRRWWAPTLSARRMISRARDHRQLDRIRPDGNRTR
jgi:hypothetical protein